MCVPALAAGVGNAAKFALSPAATIIGALGKKKPSTPTPTAPSGGGY